MVTAPAIAAVVHQVNVVNTSIGTQSMVLFWAADMRIDMCVGCWLAAGVRKQHGTPSKVQSQAKQRLLLGCLENTVMTPHESCIGRLLWILIIHDCNIGSRECTAELSVLVNPA